MKPLYRFGIVIGIITLVVGLFVGMAELAMWGDRHAIEMKAYDKQLNH